MKIHEILKSGTTDHTTRQAIRQGDHVIGYGELDATTDQLANHLRTQGLSEGHGFIFLPNSIEFAVAYFGITKAGGVVAPTPITLPHDRLISEMDYCDADYVITDPSRAEDVTSAARNSRQVRAVLTMSPGGRDWNLECFRDRQMVRPSNGYAKNNDLIAVMISTSGTASDPKRVMLSHQNILANIDSFMDIAQLTAQDRAAIVLPMTSVGTHTTEFLSYLSAGITIDIYQGIFVLGNFCKLLEQQKISVLNVTPFILTLMLSRSEEVARKVTSVRKMFFASAPFAVERYQQLIQAFPHIGFHYGYGLTEACPRCTTLTPADHPTKIGSSGRALKNVEIAILDDTGQLQKPGEFGEVAVKGPNVMLGYYKKPDQTAAVLQNEWLWTGDCGHLDEDGYLFIRGRKKNIIITRGINVSPEEVEQEILGCPGISEVYVAGYDDERLGESIVAYVVPANDVQPSQGNVKEFLRHRLDSAKIPSRIEFVSKLKRNHNQKLIRG